MKIMQIKGLKIFGTTKALAIKSNSGLKQLKIDSSEIINRSIFNKDQTYKSENYKFTEAEWKEINKDSKKPYINKKKIVSKPNVLREYGYYGHHLGKPVMEEKMYDEEDDLKVEGFNYKEKKQIISTLKKYPELRQRYSGIPIKKMSKKKEVVVYGDKVYTKQASTITTRGLQDQEVKNIKLLLNEKVVKNKKLLPKVLSHEAVHIDEELSMNKKEAFNNMQEDKKQNSYKLYYQDNEEVIARQKAKEYIDENYMLSKPKTNLINEYMKDEIAGAKGYQSLKRKLPEYSLVIDSMVKDEQKHLHLLKGIKKGEYKDEDKAIEPYQQTETGQARDAIELYLTPDEQTEYMTALKNNDNIKATEYLNKIEARQKDYTAENNSLFDSSYSENPHMESSQRGHVVSFPGKKIKKSKIKITEEDPFGRQLESRDNNLAIYKKGKRRYDILSTKDDVAFVIDELPLSYAPKTKFTIHSRLAANLKGSKLEESTTGRYSTNTDGTNQEIELFETNPEDKTEQYLNEGIEKGEQTKKIILHEIGHSMKERMHQSHSEIYAKEFTAEHSEFESPKQLFKEGKNELALDDDYADSFALFHKAKMQKQVEGSYSKTFTLPEDEIEKKKFLEERTSYPVLGHRRKQFFEDQYKEIKKEPSARELYEESKRPERIIEEELAKENAEYNKNKIEKGLYETENNSLSEMNEKELKELLIHKYNIPEDDKNLNKFDKKMLIKSINNIEREE